MQDIVVFCQSYGEIGNCLYIAKRNSQGSNSITIVIPGNHDLFMLLKKINERIFYGTINIIYFELFRPRLGRPKDITVNWAFWHFIDMIKEKRYNRRLYNKYLAKLRGAEIYFFTRSFVPHNLYFLRKLHRHNKLVYMHIAGIHKGYGDGVSKHNSENILDLLGLIRSKIVYGLDMTMARLPHVKFDYLPDRFMENEVDRIIGKEESRELLRDFDYKEFKIFETGIYSIIYFDQSLSDRDYIPDIDTFKRELDEVFDILRKYFTDKEIAIKYHPGYASDKTVINIGTVLPTFIPAELLYNEKVKMYLAIASYSIANVERGLAVSLLDLISFRSHETREQLREALISRSHSDILFPKSLEEFENIVARIREQTK